MHLLCAGEAGADATLDAFLDAAARSDNGGCRPAVLTAIHLLFEACARLSLADAVAAAAVRRELTLPVMALTGDCTGTLLLPAALCDLTLFVRVVATWTPLVLRRARAGSSVAPVRDATRAVDLLIGAEPAS